MPYTGNGKIDDRALRELDHAGDGRKAFQAPASALELQLAQIWSQVLGVPSIGVHDNFFDLGGDSIAAIQIVGRANAAGIALDAPLLLKRQTIARLAGASIGRQPAPQQVMTGPVRLTPVMNWFLAAADRPTVRNFAQLVSVQLPSSVDIADLTRALHAVINHHDAFHIRFSDGPDGWHAEQTSASARPEIAVVESGGHGAPTDAEVIARMAAQLDPGKPEMISATLVKRAGSHELLLLANHLVVDAVSWPIVLQDLEASCLQIASGRQPTLPHKTFSFQAWSEAVTHHAVSGRLDKEIRYWRSLNLSSGHARPIPVDSDLPDLQYHAATHSCSLAGAQTNELLRLSSQRNRPLQELLLIALGVAVYCQTGDTRIRFDVEGHGREPFPGAPDVSRTVGWFTSLYPVLFSMSGLPMRPSGKGVTLDSIDLLTDQLRAIPANGFSFGLIHHLPGVIESDPVADAPVLFNFLGHLRSRQTESADSWTVNRLRLYRAPEMLRRHPLEIAAWIDSGRLRVEWTYTRGPAQTDAVIKLADRFLIALQQITQALGEAGDKKTSAFDFPQAGLDSQGMNKLAAALGKADARKKQQGGAL